MSEPRTKPGILSWVALSVGMLLVYWISAVLVGLIVSSGRVSEKALLPFYPIKWLIEYLVQ